MCDNGLNSDFALDALLPTGRTDEETHPFVIKLMYFVIYFRRLVAMAAGWCG